MNPGQILRRLPTADRPQADSRPARQRSLAGSSPSPPSPEAPAHAKAAQHPRRVAPRGTRQKGHKGGLIFTVPPPQAASVSRVELPGPLVCPVTCVSLAFFTSGVRGAKSLVYCRVRQSEGRNVTEDGRLAAMPPTRRSSSLAGRSGRRHLRSGNGARLVTTEAPTRVQLPRTLTWAHHDRAALR
jgi:hypothetical protein